MNIQDELNKLGFICTRSVNDAGLNIVSKHDDTNVYIPGDKLEEYRDKPEELLAYIKSLLNIEESNG